MRKLIWTLLTLISLSFAHADPQHSDVSVTFVVVRHAEKQTSADGTSTFDPKDPALTEVGERHARALAHALQDLDLKAVYATPFLRSQATAKPTAIAHGLQISTYDPTIAATEFAAQLRANWHAGAVLVVAHSNTVSSIVSALCVCEVSALSEQDYGDRFDVRVDASGKAILSKSHF